MLSKETTHLSIAFYQNVIIAARNDSVSAQQALANLETILLRLCIYSDNETISALNEVLRYIQNILRVTSSELIDWSSENGIILFQMLLRWCQEFLPQLKDNRNSTLRATIANVLWTLQSRNLFSDALQEVLSQLRADKRARVRFAANGGWREVYF